MNRKNSDFGLRDGELVRQAQRGAAEAFAELVARYQDRVYNTCYRLCHNHDDALDLTQTTFVKALENLPRFEARAEFYTWLFRIATNLALSERRSRRRRPSVPLDNPDSHGRLHEPSERHNVAERIEQKEMHQRVEEALERLEPEFRVAVVLKDIEGLDYATIATILEVPLGTVKSRIHRGRLMLREMLTQERTELGSRQT